MNALTALCASALATLLVVSAQARDTFPDIADWSTLKITLRRGGCYSCEAYRIEVSGNGAVEYEGYGTVAVRGLHRFRLSESAVHELVAAFRRADFFDAPENNLRSDPGVVEAIPNDVLTTSIGISFDGRSREILDFAGSERLVFNDVRALEKLIDDAAGMSSWVRGDSQTLTKLEAEGWDFRIPADKHSMLITTAAEMGNSALVWQLLDKGVAVRNAYGCAALRLAAERDDLKTAALLVEARVPTSASELDQSDRYLPQCSPLDAAAEHSNVRMLKLVLELHPKIDAFGFRGRTPLMDSAGPEVTAILLAAGADPNIKDKDGKTALDYADSWNKTGPVLERWLADHPQKLPN